MSTAPTPATGDPDSRSPDARVDEAYTLALSKVSRRTWRHLAEVAQNFSSHHDDPQYFIAAPTTPAPSAISYTIPQPHPRALAVFDILMQAGLAIAFDWTSWQRGKELLTTPELITAATKVEAAKALLMVYRADRVNEGLLVTCLQNGTVTALLTQLTA